MINFLLLMLLPVLICAGYLVWLKGKECVWDIVIQVGIVAILMASGLGIAYYQGTSDTEIWNGQITGKDHIHVSCSHSYPCDPYPCNCDKNGCSTCWHTCYEHSFDVDWRVFSSTNEEINVDHVDSQGLEMPPRWGAVYIGEPFSSQHRFENYIKANPSSVLLGMKGDLKKFGPMIPAYPEVYDYYKVQHVLNEGVPGFDAASWNWLISQANRSLGPSKQVNLIIVSVPTTDPNYAYAFRDKWLGGKKNDAIILIGSQDGNKIDWADVVSWTPNKVYNIELRDRIMQIGYLTRRDEIVNAIEDEAKTNFVRMHMAFVQLIKEQNPTLSDATYLKIGQTIEVFHDSFQASQTDLIARKQNYGKFITATTDAIFYNWIGNFPHIKCGIPIGAPDDYQIVTSGKTQTDFKNHQAAPLDLNKGPNQ